MSFRYRHLVTRKRSARLGPITKKTMTPKRPAKAPHDVEETLWRRRRDLFSAVAQAGSPAVTPHASISSAATRRRAMRHVKGDRMKHMEVDELY